MNIIIQKPTNKLVIVMNVVSDFMNHVFERSGSSCHEFNISKVHKQLRKWNVFVSRK